MPRRRTLAIAAAVAIAVIALRAHGMRRPAVVDGELGDPRAVPIGYYAGGAPLPMTPRLLLLDRTFASLMGPPGPRLGESTARNRRYFGTDAVPAPNYERAKVNRPEDLEMAPLNARRTGGML